MGADARRLVAGGCHHTCKFVPIQRFAPKADAEQSAGSAQRFAAALAGFRAAHAARDRPLGSARDFSARWAG